MGENETTVEVEGEELGDLALVRNALLRGELVTEVDPEATARRIVEEIVNASTADEAMAERPVWGAAESVGSAFLLRGVRWYPSSLEQGPKVFAAVDVVNADTGEAGILTTSAYKQLAKLFVLAREDAFPRHVRVVTSTRPTAGGYWPLDFEDVPAAPEED